MKRLATVCALVGLILTTAAGAEGKTLRRRSLDRKVPTDWCPLGAMTSGDVFRFQADGPSATVTFAANGVPLQGIDSVVVVEEGEYAAHLVDDSSCFTGSLFDLSSGTPVFLDRFDSDANGWALSGARFDPSSSDDFDGGSLAFDPGGSASITFGGLEKGKTYVVSSSWSTQDSSQDNAVTLAVDTRDPAALYLGGGRFRVDASWTTAKGAKGAGTAIPLSDDTGYFWFFSPSNVEVTVKVIDGCGLNDAYWFFASGLTDVRVDLRVTDTASGKSKTYVNPVRTSFKPIQDTSALATCP